MSSLPPLSTASSTNRWMGLPWVRSCHLSLPASSSLKTEQMSLSRVAYKSTSWFCYVVDISLTTSTTYILTSNSPRRLLLNGHLSFLDIDIYRRQSGSLEHTVYGKPTYTNLYVNVESHHHMGYKHSVSTFVH